VSMPWFATEAEALDYLRRHDARMFHGAVHVPEGWVEEARVARPGWYVCRTDLRRFLPLRLILVREPFGQREGQELPAESCAAPDAGP
jgi:hypothetical protein